MPLQQCLLLGLLVHRNCSTARYFAFWFIRECRCSSAPQTVLIAIRIYASGLQSFPSTPPAGLVGVIDLHASDGRAIRSCFGRSRAIRSCFGRSCHQELFLRSVPIRIVPGGRAIRSCSWCGRAIRSCFWCVVPSEFSA